MHPIVATSLAVEMDRLGTIVRRSGTWPSPATGFATWLVRRHQPLGLLAPVDASVALGDLQRLDEAPVLAAYGYLLTDLEDPDPTIVQAWNDAASRLCARDPLPGDRASFFFRATELLGIALGTNAIAAHDPEPRRWLRQTLRRGRDQLGTDPWSVVLASLAAANLGDTGGSGHLRPMRETSAVDLAVCWLMADHHQQTATAIGVDQDTRALESALLYQLTTSTITTLDTAEAAAVYTAAAAAIGTGLARPELGLPAALITITGVLRRFPAIVRELDKRHDRRPSLVNISDEYDVQDLLRGVLRGLFDDVRDEEYTPSHAGVRSRMDLLLKREQIVIETKMTRANLDQRRVAEELAIDKEVYRSHPDCQTLVCFVYDPTHRLANPTALEDDLSEFGGPMPTTVIVAPH